jgi:hypothetical protein
MDGIVSILNGAFSASKDAFRNVYILLGVAIFLSLVNTVVICVYVAWRCSKHRADTKYHDWKPLGVPNQTYAAAHRHALIRRA